METKIMLKNSADSHFSASNEDIHYHIENINRYRLSLYTQLFLYGDIIPLNFKIDLQKLEEELQKFSERWVIYQPSKPETRRMGLSVTSLDGGMSGYPDLCSLQEYHAKSGKKLSENDFNVLTEAGKNIFSISKILNHFSPSLGRCRFVKFACGGHFPPHRDRSIQFSVPDYFRIFVPLIRCTPEAFFFILEERVIQYEPGRAYLFNALKSHTVFSTIADAVTLALSVPLTQENIVKAINTFSIR